MITMLELAAASEIESWAARLLISSIAISPLLIMVTEDDEHGMTERALTPG